MSKEAMKLARENFATAKELCDKHSKLDRRIVYGNALITHFDAVCQALAEQPAQQEQVAIHQVFIDGGWRGKEASELWQYPAELWQIRTLYTTPQAQPAREWVGLTPEEVQAAVYDENGCVVDYEDYASAIEAKLREKNK